MDDVTYIGVKDNIEQNRKVKNNETVTVKKFKTKKYSRKLSKFISSTKRKIFNKKILIIIAIIVAIFYFKPITFLKAKLNEKREFYSLESSNEGILNSFMYSFGVDYYKNCKKTMVMPADGLITCQYDLSHQGIDIACENYQDNVYAVQNGYVCYVGHDLDKGNELIIEHEINGMKIYTYYSNLSIINVSNGDYVYQNQVIAQEGGNPNKRATVLDFEGHHVHFEVRKNTSPASALNPNIFIDF